MQDLEKILELECWSIADKVVERCERGLPPDRWTIGTQELREFIKAYRLLTHLTQILHEEVERCNYESGLEAMSLKPDNSAL